MTLEPFLTFLGGLLVALGGAWIKGYWERKRRLDAMQVPAVFARAARVYHTLQVLRDEAGALQCVVLRAENGGRIPKVGSPLHSSVAYEAFDEKNHSVSAAWDKQRLDEWYTRMLAELISRGQVHIITDDIPDDTPLKDVYRSNGVAFSHVTSLTTTSNALFYLSVTFAEGRPEDLSPQQRNSIRAAATRLRGLIKDEHA